MNIRKGWKVVQKKKKRNNETRAVSLPFDSLLLYEVRAKLENGAREYLRLVNFFLSYVKTFRIINV